MVALCEIEEAVSDGLINGLTISLVEVIIVILLEPFGCLFGCLQFF